MTVETQLKALFNIPDNVQATPAAMAIEFESLMARLEIKQKYVKNLYEQYLAEADSIEAAYGGRTICANTGIAELGFSDKCTNALLKKGVNKLGDLAEVSRRALVKEKTIGGDNVARLDRIIGAAGISYKVVEEYQDAGEDVVDDSILEENDKGLRNNLAASDREIEKEIKERVAQEVEDFKTSYKDAMCDDCSYRRAAETEECPEIGDRSDEKEEKVSQCMNCAETICAETGICVKEHPVALPQEDYVPNEADKLTKLIETEPAQLEENPVGFDFPVPAESTEPDFVSFLDSENLEAVEPASSEELVPEQNNEAVSFINEYGQYIPVEVPGEENMGIRQFLNDLEDEPSEPETENNPEAFEKSNEEKVFSQIADLIDVDGYEPTVEGEDGKSVPRQEGDVELFEQPPVFNINENFADNTFVSPAGDIFTGVKEDIDVSGDDDFEENNYR